MAKPETFPKGPHAAMGVRGPPGEDPGRSFAAAENMEAVARADGGAVDRRRSHATQEARRDTKAQAERKGASQP